MSLMSRPPKRDPHNVKDLGTRYLIGGDTSLLIFSLLKNIFSRIPDRVSNLDYVFSFTIIYQCLRNIVRTSSLNMFRQRERKKENEREKEKCITFLCMQRNSCLYVDVCN